MAVHVRRKQRKGTAEGAMIVGLHFVILFYFILSRYYPTLCHWIYTSLHVTKVRMASFSGHTGIDAILHHDSTVMISVDFKKVSTFDNLLVFNRNT
jgi:hypothetical protein